MVFEQKPILLRMNSTQIDAMNVAWPVPLGVHFHVNVINMFASIEMKERAKR